jgi:hypothetical protein
MSIVRRHHNSNFTVVPNAIFDDGHLSIEAKGVLGYLLSRPHDWTVRLVQIGSVLGMGRYKTERVFQELIEARYVKRNGQRRTATGWGAADYVVYDNPASVDDQFVPSENLHAENLHAGDLHAGNQGTYKVLKELSTDSTKAAADDTHAPEGSKSLITAEAHQLADTLLRLRKLDLEDPKAVGTAYQAQTWLTKGWRAELIVHAVETVMATRSAAPRSLRYFEDAIAEAHAEHDRPLPVTTISRDRPRRPDGGRGSGSVSDVLRSLSVS